jgi:manganese oxidase
MHGQPRRARRQLAIRVLGVVLGAAGTANVAAAERAELASAGVIAPNGNTKAAGVRTRGVLTLQLWAGMGRWEPEGAQGTGLEVAAFGEEGHPLTTPGPLVRVPAGTRVRATIRNTLTADLHVFGLHGRPGSSLPVVVPAGRSREVSFALTDPGTYYYWASTDTHGSLVERRSVRDTQLGGAIVVDEGDRPASDRVLVMTLADERDKANRLVWDVLTINGRSWPLTERLAHVVGEEVRWRVINLTSRGHPMHLHGFYFSVDSMGNGASDRAIARAERPLVVTHNMQPGDTIGLRWTPERPGNWLFHCHILAHMMPVQHPGEGARPVSGEHHHDAGDPAQGMRGLVMGITVTGRQTNASRDTSPVRSLRLTVSADARHGAGVPAYRFDLEEHGVELPRLGPSAVPGPPLVLTRGQPVAVEIVNRLEEPTAIHWHGIELDSFDDGVAGFGGDGSHVTPPVAPGGRFVARFTPARAGTFIYHTHWHNEAQLSAGLYGPIVVLEPGGHADAATDHLIVLGLDGPPGSPSTQPVVNGQRKPGPLELRAGVPHRLRLINITPNNGGLYVQMTSALDLAPWTLLAKDGAAVPRSPRAGRLARINVSVGETYDVELPPPTPGQAARWMELRRANGELLAQWPVVVR